MYRNFHIHAMMAVNNEGVIGHNNSIPWKHKEDLQRFKFKTSAAENILLCGYNTFKSLEAIGFLPGRTIATIDKNCKVLSEEHLEDKDTSLVVSPNLNHIFDRFHYDGNNFIIIGGVKFIKEHLSIIDTIELSRINDFFKSENDEENTYWDDDLLEDFRLVKQEYPSETLGMEWPVQTFRRKIEKNNYNI